MAEKHKGGDSERISFPSRLIHSLCLLGPAAVRAAVTATAAATGAAAGAGPTAATGTTEVKGEREKRWKRIVVESP